MAYLAEGAKRGGKVINKYNEPETGARPSVLIVEDSKTTKALLAKHLGERYHAREADDGQEAWDILQADHRIELVVTDLHMPRLSGQELLVRIRTSTDPSINGLPVIVLTAADETADKHLAFQNGANDFISKPVDALELRARVSVHYTLARTIRELEKSQRALAELAATDPLTGLKNRRTFNEYCANAFAVAARNNSELSVLFIDVDHFKHINDTHGHAAGDRVLMNLAQLLLTRLRDSDTVGRVGGEEFAVLLPNTNRLTAAVIAERIRTSVERAAFSFEEKTIAVTVSVGLAMYDSETVKTIDQLMAIADQRVYLAKKHGRNRICVNDAGHSTFCGSY